MARNVILRNILKDKNRRWIWAALRASKLTPLIIGLVFGSKETKKRIKQFAKKHPVKMLTGSMMPTKEGVPIEERWDTFDLYNTVNVFSWAGGNILAEQINDFFQKMEWGKEGKLKTAYRAVERLAPQVISLPMEEARLEQKKKEQTTEYMRRKIQVQQTESGISGLFGIKPLLVESMEMEKKEEREGKKTPTKKRLPLGYYEKTTKKRLPLGYYEK